MTTYPISLLAHADWSKNKKKRWVAIAVLQANQRWSICELLKISETSNFFTYLQLQKKIPGSILSGFDFPIGIPKSYADKARIDDFLPTLPLFGHNEWEDFYTPATVEAEISIHRPFYPEKPGGTKRSSLEDRLNLKFEGLYRLCERSHDNRRSACPLFWTLGGQQVGKAAITGWRDLIAPALADPKLNLRIWPFSGNLASLCNSSDIIVVETYPAEFYHQLGLSFSSPFRRSKRRQSDRILFANQLLSWSAKNQHELDPSIVALIVDGFGKDEYGEDRFDALIGLYGMINLVCGNKPLWEPDTPQITRIEGWIFGQDQPIGTGNDTTANS